jgi:hypothetical protein
MIESICVATQEIEESHAGTPMIALGSPGISVTYT